MLIVMMLESSDLSALSPIFPGHALLSKSWKGSTQTKPCHATPFSLISVDVC